MDFSKAFDTVPHQRLVNKMEHYGIKGNTHRWVSSWLTQRPQRVCVDGEESSNKPVISGVPQGIVLGPLCFLIYINDMEKSISRTSTLRLFADVSLLYRPVNTTDDDKKLQEDLTELTKWADKWQMTFHPAKCYILRVTRKKIPIITNYEMLGQQLETVHQYPYLGVELSEDLGWEPHINKVISKANRTLGFLRRNIYKCPHDIKSQAYISLVRLHLEYASSVWDPFRKYHINALEMVQRKAARFATSNYTREPITVTTILQNLGWQTLENRRKMARLTLLYKSINGEEAVNIPPYLTKPTIRTKQYHSQRFSRLIPRTISDWNNRFPVKSAPSQIGSSQIGPSQIGPNSNRPQVKSAPSQIGLKMKVISAQKNKNKKRINK